MAGPNNNSVVLSPPLSSSVLSQCRKLCVVLGLAYDSHRACWRPYQCGLRLEQGVNVWGTKVPRLLTMIIHDTNKPYNAFVRFLYSLASVRPQYAVETLKGGSNTWSSAHTPCLNTLDLCCSGPAVCNGYSSSTARGARLTHSIRKPGMYLLLVVTGIV